MKHSNQGRDGALRRPAFAKATAGRPRRVQRRNQSSGLFDSATMIGRRGNSARCFAGGDVAARRPYHGPTRLKVMERESLQPMDANRGPDPGSAAILAAACWHLEEGRIVILRAVPRSCCGQDGRAPRASVHGESFEGLSTAHRGLESGVGTARPQRSSGDEPSPPRFMESPQSRFPLAFEP